MNNNIPSKVLKLLYDFNGWLVGSSVDKQNPKDYDILIPFSEWSKACICVPNDATKNRFGGWKFKEDGIEIDIWPGDLSWFVTLPDFKKAYNYRYNVLLCKEGINEMA